MKPAETLSVTKWQQELQAAAQPGKTAILSSFFKTGKGEYGEGDTFIGVTVPANRAVSRRYAWLSLDEISEMIDSEVHEFRLGGMLALVERYRKARTDADRNAVVDFYLANGHKANNWDLVDLSSPYILGAEIAAGRRTGQIDRLIASGNLWRQRIAMVSMLNPVMKHGDTAMATATASKLITHPHDLMRKAVGWVLREVGKKDIDALLRFLSTHIASISATTLSYATEKLPKEERLHWRTLRRTSQSPSTLATPHKNMFEFNSNIN